MAKAPKVVKYRVRKGKTSFVAGALRREGEIVEAPEGLEGSALELVIEGSGPPARPLPTTAA